MHICGVFILAKHNILSSFLQSSALVKLIWVRVRFKCTRHCFGMLLLPPMAHISVLESSQNSLHEVKSAYPTAKVFLGGAFNSPGIN